MLIPHPSSNICSNICPVTHFSTVPNTGYKEGGGGGGGGGGGWGKQSRVIWKLPVLEYLAAQKDSADNYKPEVQPPLTVTTGNGCSHVLSRKCVSFEIQYVM